MGDNLKETVKKAEQGLGTPLALLVQSYHNIVEAEAALHAVVSHSGKLKETVSRDQSGQLCAVDIYLKGPNHDLQLVKYEQKSMTLTSGHNVKRSVMVRNASQSNEKDVKGHRVAWTDWNLKRAIVQKQDEIEIF